jgi:hypothetical protein
VNGHEGSQPCNHSIYFPYFQVGFHVVWQVWIFAWAELFVLACLPGQSRIATWSMRRIQQP